MSFTATTTQLDAKEADARASFASSSTSTLCTTSQDSSSFYPSRTLNVGAKGIGAFRLPLPDRQFEITISGFDGTAAYVSGRDKRWSGNSVLSAPKLGNLIRTEYFVGPNRDPVLRLLQTTSVIPEEIKIKSKWGSRSIQFTMPAGAEYQWSYEKEKRPDGEKLHLVTLHAIENPDNKTNGQPNRRVAQLVRSAETRTPGTHKCSAGNGGELQIDDGALNALNLDESIVVATCLVVLKREVDRRRIIQMAVIAGGAGS